MTRTSFLASIICLAMAASAQVHSVVSVESVVQLRTALASSSCQKVIITQDIEVDEDSWPADDVVSILNRTVVVTSAESLGATPQSWPLLNANYMFWRISLKENATLIFRRLWLARLNTLNVIAYPGVVLIKPSSPPEKAAAVILDQAYIVIAVAGNRLPVFDPITGIIYLPRRQIHDTYWHSQISGSPTTLNVFTRVYSPICRAESKAFAAYCWSMSRAWVLAYVASDAADGRSSVAAPAGYTLIANGSLLVANFIIPDSCMEQQGGMQGLTHGFQTCYNTYFPMYSSDPIIPVPSTNTTSPFVSALSNGQQVTVQPPAVGLLQPLDAARQASPCHTGPRSPRLDIILPCALGGTLFVVLVVGAALWTSCHKTAQADAAHKSVTSKDVTGRAEADKLGACKAGTPYASCTISTSSSRASPQSPPRTAMHTCQESFEGHKALATQTTHIAWKVPVVGREAFASLCGMGLGKFAVGRGNVLRFEHRNASDPALPPLPTGLRLGVDVFLEGPQGMQLMAQWRTSPAVVCSKADDTALLGSTVVVHCTEKPPHAASSALLQGHPQATEGLPDVALVLDALEARGLGDSLMAKSQDMQHADAAVSHTPPTMRADSMRDLHMTEAYPMGGQAAGSPQQQDTDVHQVGIGNTARVLRGTYRGHSVAVKLLHPALVVGQRAAQDAAHALAMEALLLQQTHHPCIVRVLGAGLAPPLPFLVLEEMPRCLADIILDTTQPLFLAQVIKISFDLASALEYLHPGILHRDINPANVLLDASGWNAKLCDFGLARVAQGLSTLYTDYGEAGTSAYLAPECFQPEGETTALSWRVDIYALGVLMVEMITRRAPWEGQSRLQVAMATTLLKRRPVLPPGDHVCPGPLRKLIQACLEHEPRFRPSAAELAKRLALLAKQMHRQVSADAESGIDT